jgi:AraC family ethanolamine operon transcriptional activator
MDTMALTMIGGHVNFVPLRPGPFHGRFCQIDLDGFVLRRMAHGPLLMHGTAKPGHVALQLMARPVEGVTLNGDAFGASTLSVIPGCSEIQAVCSAELDRIALIVHAEMFDRLIEACGAPAFPRDAHRLLHLPDHQAGMLVRALGTMTDLAESLPNLLAVPGLGEALTEECQRLIAAVLIDTEGRPERPRRTRDMLRQVGAADEFLRANIDRPVYTDELCAALHVSARTLHQSFAAVYGMSPHAYLKRRRLILVHRALRAAREGRAMVKSVALAHGFWHLGRFAQEYATMFGEMPSETLDRGRGRTGPPMA